MAPYDKRCAACGETAVQRLARPGRRHVYKGIELEIPSTLALVECEKCGERYLTQADLAKLDDALGSAYVDHLRLKLGDSIEKLKTAGFTLAHVERELGLSLGYLSKVRKKVEPSFQLVALLALVADHPLRNLARLHGLRRASSTELH